MIRDSKQDGEPNRNLKVLHVIRSIDKSTGGPAFAVMQIADTLNKNGITVDIASTVNNNVALPKKNNKNSNLYLFKNQAGGTWSFSWPLWRWLKSNIKNYNVVHITGIFTFPVLAAAMLSKKFGIPYILRPAGTLDVYPMAQKSFRKKLYYKLVIERYVKGAAAIHVTSQKEKEQVGLIGINDNCFIAPLGVDANSSTKLFRKDDHLRILFLSRIHQKKGLPILLEAVSLLVKSNTTISLTIAGNGSEKYLGELKDLIKKLEIEEVVKFSGFVEGEKKSHLFDETDIFVLPSYQENFGIAVVEALAAGMPVIVSDQVAIADDIIEAGAGHVVPVDQPEELAKAISLYTKLENRQLASKKAIDLVKSKYSLSALQENLHSLYCKVS